MVPYSGTYSCCATISCPHSALIVDLIGALGLYGVGHSRPHSCTTAISSTIRGVAYSVDNVPWNYKLDRPYNRTISIYYKGLPYYKAYSSTSVRPAGHGRRENHRAQCKDLEKY